MCGEGLRSLENAREFREKVVYDGGHEIEKEREGDRYTYIEGWGLLFCMGWGIR